MGVQQINFEKDNEYYTPKYIVDHFGRFDYDPATTKTKAKELEIQNYDTIDTNGLNSNWNNYHRIWINPPFTNKKEFLEKAIETYNNNRSKEIYILLPIEFITTKKFNNAIQKLWGGCKFYIPNGRISFESGLGKKEKAPAFGSIIIKLQEKNEIEFIDIKG